MFVNTVTQVFFIIMFRLSHSRRVIIRSRRCIFIFFERLTKIHNLPCDLVILISAFIILWFYFNNYFVTQKFNNAPKSVLSEENYTLGFQDTTKYILLWTGSIKGPFMNFPNGNKVFTKRKCKWTNCFVTTDRYFLKDYTEFDVILFDGQLLEEYVNDLPVKRTRHQKFVYVNKKPSVYFPLCTSFWNGYFNWTWTYKLNSDAVWSFFVIRNASSHVIGPNQNMDWLKPDKMDDIDEEVKTKLKKKVYPAAWFVSNCRTRSLREKYVQKLRRHLKKYNMDVYVFGVCGKFGCPRELMQQCMRAIENNFFFYLAFESAITDDYVTEKLLYALNHNSVPIVFGGANYSRFMPEGSYLNAYNKNAQILADKIYHIINNTAIYHNFFRWKKYYTYHLRNESPDTDEFCDFCAKINDEILMRKTTIYKKINEWWTGSNVREICHQTNKRYILPVMPSLLL